MWKACALLVAVAALSQAQTLYPEGEPVDLEGCYDDTCLEEVYRGFDASNVYFEWEGYDGWYNNPAHPDWGGAGALFG